MKIKKRNIATIILAILCAIALAIGVSFVAPKIEKISANAATVSATPTITFGQLLYFGGSNYNQSITEADVSTSLASYVSSSTSGNSISTTILATPCSDYQINTIIASQVEMSVVVPAHTVYTIKYTNSHSMAGKYGQEHGILDEWSTDPSAGFYFDSSTFGSGGRAANLNGDNEQRPNCGPHPNGHLVSLYNDTDNSKKLSVYTYYLHHIGDGGPRGIAYTTNFSFDSFTVTAADIGAPSASGATTATYDGNNIQFGITYNTPDVEDFDGYVTYSTAYKNIVPTVYSAKYPDGTDISSSTYEIENLDSDGTATSANGTFKATEAGTYTLKFSLSADAITNGIEWSTGGTGDKTLTFTITRKGLTVPTVTNPQIYTGSALTFVLSDFNSGQNISMDGVTPPSGATVTNSNGGTPTDTTDTFKAIKVGKYTVTFNLRDTNNYTWTGGSTSAKTVEFEITQKELLSSAPVSSKVNSIGGAEWNYGDNTVTVEVTDNRVSGENINLLFYYDSKANTLTDVTTTGNTTVITMPDDIAVGTHTLYVELNGTTGDNANYKLTQNNTLSFEVKSAKVDHSNYTWIYTKDGAAGGTISDGDKLPFVLKTGSTVDGVKYELSIQIPSSDSVAVDTSKYASGYQLRSCDSVGSYTTVVALKSTDPTFQFEVNGVMQSTIDVELKWEIEQGTFDLSNVKWEYNLDGTTAWKDYDPANPPQYNDGNYITVRIKSTSLPMGLTLDSTYVGMEKANVGTYTATVSLSDLKYNTTNFKAPDVSKLTLNWEIAKKNLYTRFKNVSESYSNASYSGTFILKQLDVPANMESYISYTYYDMSTGLAVTLADIKDAVDPTDEKNYKVVATIDPAYSANYTVDDNGASPSDTFTTGSQNELAKATVDGNDGKTAITAEYDGNTHFDSSLIEVKSDSGIVITDYTVVYYSGKTATTGNELAAGDLPKDAGEYCIQIVLGTTASRRYILERDIFEIVIEAKGIAIPELGAMTFNGKELKFEDFLGGTWNDYKSIIQIDGKLSDRNVSASYYVTTLTLTDSNYKWIYPSAATPVKATVKTALAAAGVSVTGDDTVATYNWNITPLVVDTTNLWNKSASGATLNLPQTVKDLIAGGTLAVGYRYYDGEGTLLDDVELKGGRSFKVEAVFTGDDAERNVQFKTSDTEYGAVSKSIDYTVPQSGAAAFMNSVKEFMTKTWLGLPVWAWFLIGLALLILLIIIIVVAVKRRKSKEEREEIKARKEEEKARREEERQMQREKLEAERELAKAKQEAELEKIRMQAQMSAGAGMASMAMQQPQQPQQAQPVQQPQPQQIPVPQYTNDGAVLAEIRAELAEIKARQNMSQGYSQPPMQMPMQMPMPMPMAMPQYMPMPQPQGGGNGGYEDARLLLAEERARTAESRLADERARAAEEKSYRSMEERAMLAEERFVRGNGMPVPQLPAQTMPVNQVAPVIGNNPEFIGAVIASALRNSGVAPAAITSASTNAEPQQIEEKSVATAPAVYPSDAVITTTTTVDTTKGKPVMRQREQDTNFDVDGFYDKYE